MFETEDTIASISTAPGEAGIGVIRISGRKALAILLSIFSISQAKTIEDHRIYHGWIINPENKSNIDEVIVSYMKSPRSYTGEDIVEISCHGGSAVLNKILSVILHMGAKLAERGEFTKRAFLNGKIDLIQAEAVIDLITARTERATTVAADQLSGKLSKEINKLREKALSLLAEIEASIDFPDEIGNLETNTLYIEIEGIIRNIELILATYSAGKILRDGISCAIIGKPNVGKSSVLNAIVKYDRAIVTEIPGTTTDTIEEFINIQGFPFRFIDTAGIRNPGNQVEEAGIERANAAIEQSDIVIVVIDGSKRLEQTDIDILTDYRIKEKSIIVINKMDLKSVLEEEDFKRKGAIIKISALKGTGIEKLEKAIENMVISNKIESSVTIITNTRHNEKLKRAKMSLEKANNSIKNRMPIDFIAIDLRDSIEELGEMTGQSISNELIDNIFGRFCIGK